MRIGIVGTGRVGQAMATGLGKAGHDVFLVSRTPDTKTGLPAPVKGLDELASAELVINASPGKHSLETLKAAGPDALPGKVLLDIAHATNDDLSLVYPDSSLGEQLQQAFPQTHVVKSLCTMSSAVMIDPGQLAGPTSVFLSGEDAGAKQTVSTLLSDLGWSKEQQIDLGGIQTARGGEHYLYLFMALMQQWKTPLFNLAVVRPKSS